MKYSVVLADLLALVLTFVITASLVDLCMVVDRYMSGNLSSSSGGYKFSKNTIVHVADSPECFARGERAVVISATQYSRLTEYLLVFADGSTRWEVESCLSKEK